MWGGAGSGGRGGEARGGRRRRRLRGGGGQARARAAKEEGEGEGEGGSAGGGGEPRGGLRVVLCIKCRVDILTLNGIYITKVKAKRRLHHICHYNEALRCEKQPDHHQPNNILRRTLQRLWHFE